MEVFEGSYTQFFLQHLIPNEPALLNVDINNWACKRQWSDDNNQNSFNIHKFCDLYKNLTAPVYDCSKTYHNSNPCQDVQIKDFKSIWLEDVNGSRYLKDWHLYKEYKKQDKLDKDMFYQVPVYFQSDWLNEYYDSKSVDDDYRVVY